MLSQSTIRVNQCHLMNRTKWKQFLIIRVKLKYIQPVMI